MTAAAPLEFGRGPLADVDLTSPSTHAERAASQYERSSTRTLSVTRSLAPGASSTWAKARRSRGERSTLDPRALT